MKTEVSSSTTARLQLERGSELLPQGQAEQLCTPRLWLVGDSGDK